MKSAVASIAPFGLKTALSELRLCESAKMAVILRAATSHKCVL